MQDRKACAGCGFLGVESRDSPGDLDHVGSDYRANGQHDWNRFNAIPRCYKLAYPLPNEWNSRLEQLTASNVPNPNRQAAVLVIQESRESCQQWEVYIPGFSPKDRVSMAQQEKSFDIQQKLLDVQGKMLRLQESFSEWKRAEADRERNSWWWNQLLNAVIAIITAFITALVTTFASRKL